MSTHRNSRPEGEVLIDALGTAHEVASGPIRIVSLVPSITELLCDLGLGPQLVGRTGYCIHPDEIVRNIPKVGGTKTVNVHKLRTLDPTHVIVNIDENEKDTVEEIRSFVPHVVVTHPIQVEDNFGLFALMGGLFGRELRATQLSQQLREALAQAQRHVAEPLGVLYLIWKDPWMTVSRDTYVANMLAAAGLQIVAPPSAQRYPQLDWAKFDASAVQVVLLSSEPYRFTQAEEAAIRQIPSLRDRPVRLIDGEMVSWYGSRAIAGVAYLRTFRQQLEQEPA